MTVHPPTPCLGVVVPCYNEAERVADALAAVLASPWTAEVIVIDDGSTDATAKLIEAVARTDERIRFLRQPCNLGKGAALRRGFREVTAPYVIVQDADLEYDPEDWGDLLQPLLKGDADVVFGSRFQANRPHRVLYYWHSVGNRFLTTLSNAATNINLTDMETCSKVFRREVIQSLDLHEDRFGFEPEITAKVAAGGWRIYETAVSYRGRTYAEGKKIGWRDGVRAIWCIGRYSRPGERLASALVPTPAPTAIEEAGDEMASMLQIVREEDAYAEWIVTRFDEHLRGRILEIGAGIGTITQHLAERGEVVAVEPSTWAAEELARTFAGDRRVEVVQGSVADVGPQDPFDVAVLVNVLEHVEDDVGVLRDVAARLAPGGRVLCFVPAHALLHSRHDDAIGRHRRYRRSALAEAFAAAGFTVDELRHLDPVGAAAWLVAVRGLGLRPSAGSTAIYERTVLPLARWVEERWTPDFGQTLVAVARRGDATT